MNHQRRPVVRQRISPVQVSVVLLVLAFAGWSV